MKMIDSIMALPLLIGVLYLLLFAYRKIRIDLFRDKVFRIRRSLFLIAADNSEEFFKDKSAYRFFEDILNATLRYTENFSLFSSILDTNIRFKYAKKKQIDPFDFDSLKEAYLEKIKSPETREEVSKLLDDFQFHYGLFLFTRTFFGSLAFIGLCISLVIFVILKPLYEQNKRDLKKLLNWFYDYFKLSKMMNNSQFAYIATRATL